MLAWVLNLGFAGGGTPPAPSIYETIPYLIGSTEAQARQMLSSIYMVVSVVGSGGTVTAQSVDAFTLATRGTTVEITMGGAIYIPPKGGGNLPYNTH